MPQKIFGGVFVLESALNYQIALGIVGVVFPDCIDFLFPLVSRKVESDAVVLGVDDVLQFQFEFGVFRIVDEALEHRILHALSVIFAYFCDAP